VRAIASVVIFAAACSYSDPDLGGTRFRCDGNAPCPSGQKCVSAVCVAATADGVACTTKCEAGEKCCVDEINPPRCMAATDSCPGRAAFCDGVEDCGSDQVCCTVGVDLTCQPSCSQAACQTAEDCPSGSPNCCTDSSGPVPWKVCQFEPCS
jgi:hypothetical protein